MKNNQEFVKTQDKANYSMKYFMQDLEISKPAEEMPKMILKMPKNQIVYVYKNIYGRAWLECTLNLHDDEFENSLRK
jgi:hypothetical protein